MLKTMRNSFHHLKWTLFVVIVVFILGFVFWSGSGTDQNKAGQVVAEVGGERITAVEFDRQYRAQVERYRQMYQGNFSPELERALDLPRNVLDSMIERMLRLEAAKRLDLHVSDDELAKKIVTLPFFQDNGQFIGREKYEKMLRSNNIVPERFEEELREDMLLEKYAGLVKASVVVPDAELAREFSDAQRQGHDRVHPRARRPPRVQRAADRRGPAGVPRQAQGPLPRARPAQDQVPARRPGARARQDDAQRGRRARRVRAAQGLVQRSRAGHRRAHPHRGQAGRRRRTRTRSPRPRPRPSPRAPRCPAPTSPSSPTRTRTIRAARRSGGQLPPFSHGQMVPEFEQAAFSMAPGRDPRARQDAVRIPHHQARLEDAGAHAHASKRCARRSSPS